MSKETKAKYSYDFPRASVTVDCVLFGLSEDKLKVLLIQRAHDPFAGKWALPGGFIEMEESLETSALRELEEETGLSKIYLEQLYTFGDCGRDPRGRTISVAYFALVQAAEHHAKGADDASAAEWFPVDKLPKLAFDHAKILDCALTRLRAKVRYQPIGFELLPRKFTLSQLQRLYELILGRELDKRNFRKKILGMSVLEELDEVEAGGARRPAKLYRFHRKQYDALVKQGFHFEI